MSSGADFSALARWERGSWTRAMEAGAEALGKAVLWDSRSDVPVDTGTLRNSGEVEKRGKTAEVSYGKPGSGAEDYALFAHQGSRFRPRNGKQFFLRKAALRTGRGKVVGDAMRREL